MSFQLRRLREDEAAAAAGLYRATAIDPAEPAFDGAELWGAFSGDVMFGFVAFRPGWIDHLYVHPDRRRIGVGSALVMIAKESWPGLKVLAREDDPISARFWDARGFDEDGGGKGLVRYRWEED